jgi:hypothetical protein
MGKGNFSKENNIPRFSSRKFRITIKEKRNREPKNSPEETKGSLQTPNRKRNGKCYAVVNQSLY